MSERIRHVRVERHDLALARPYTIAGRTISTVENILVVLQDGAGRVGLGSAAPSAAVTGETIEACFRAAGTAAEFARAWQGEPRALAASPAFEACVGGAPAARAAVEMAVLDLVARQRAVPLVALLGGACHWRMPTSVTIGIQPAATTLEEARRLTRAGFGCLKIKIGNDVDADIAMLERVRALVGDTVRIRVDPNQGYDLRTLTHFLERSRRFAIELVEQPMPRGASALLGTLATQGHPPFAADEDLHTPAEARTLAAAGDYQAFNIKLMKCGGVVPALEIAGIARRHGVALMWGCMDESVVSIAAALHAAFAAPATRFLDLDGSLDLAADFAVGGFVLDRGELALTGAPGLGVSLAMGE